MIVIRCEMYEEQWAENSYHQENETALAADVTPGVIPVYYYTVTHTNRTFHFCSLYCLHMWSHPDGNQFKGKQ